MGLLLMGPPPTHVATAGGDSSWIAWLVLLFTAWGLLQSRHSKRIVWVARFEGFKHSMVPVGHHIWDDLRAAWRFISGPIKAHRFRNELDEGYEDSDLDYVPKPDRCIICGKRVNKRGKFCNLHDDG